MLLNCKEQSFWDNGQLMRECQYINGKINGKLREWHSNGKLRTEIDYVDDKWNGKYKSWDIDGTLRVEYNYTNDKLYGKSMEWYKNGKLREIVEYHNSKDEYYKKCWDEDGKLVKECVYNNGVEVPPYTLSLALLDDLFIVYRADVKANDYTLMDKINQVMSEFKKSDQYKNAFLTNYEYFHDDVIYHDLKSEEYYVYNGVEKYYVLAIAINYKEFNVFSKHRDVKTIDWSEPALEIGSWFN